MAPENHINTKAAIPWILTGILGVAAVGFFYEARVARMEERTAALQELVHTLQEKKDEPRPVQIISVPMPSLPSRTNIYNPLALKEDTTEAIASAKEDKKSHEITETKQPEVAKSTVATLTVDNQVQEEDPADSDIPSQPQTEEEKKDISQTLATRAPLEGTTRTGTLVDEFTALKGRVLVSQPRQRRIMIDLGRKAGIESGSRFTLWRNGLYIGEVRVKTVFDAMSACEVTSAAGSGIRIGDRVHQVKAEMAYGPLAE